MLSKHIAALAIAASFVSLSLAQPTQDEMKQLEGIWAFVSGYERGQHTTASSSEKARAFRVVIRGNNVTFRPAEPPNQDYIARVFPQLVPKGIDLRDSQGTAQGIYELSGDTLRMRLRAPGHPRPTSFAPPQTENEFTLVLKRQR